MEKDREDFPKENVSIIGTQGTQILDGFEIYCGERHNGKHDGR
jgi:hypothetical protein